jgi:hypothetical protein
MFHSMARLTVPALCAIVAVSIPAQNQLSSGTGAGSVTVTVDGWGMFGGCPNQTYHSDALYKNASGAGPYQTICYSAVLLEDTAGCPAPGRTLLALTDSLYSQFPSQPTNPAVNVIVPGRHIQTTAAQVVCGLTITIDQRLEGPDPAGGSYEGSTLVQTYSFTNTGATPRTFKCIRFTDSDLSAAFSGNRGGASIRLADCGLPTPYLSNKEWVFEFDPLSTPGVVVGIAAEGVDDQGQPVKTSNYRVHTSSVGHPDTAFTSNPTGFLNDTIDNDLDGDLIVASPELAGDFAMFQLINFTVNPGGTASGVFRTRWTSMDVNSITPVETQARDVACRTWNGNYSGTGFGSLLCVNGQGQCASVPAATPFAISLSPTASGPSPADYLVFGIFGQPAAGTACGSPQVADAALWGPPFGTLGFGAFPVSSSLATWSGGGVAVGIPLISSLPGVALITAPQATGAFGPCSGANLLAVPGLPGGLSVTLQAAIVDGGAFPLPVSLTNAVNLVIGCPCQVH